MDIEEFKRKGRIINEHTVEDLTEEYQKLLDSYRQKYINQIIEVVQEYLRGIPESYLEQWIEENLISNAKSTGTRQIAKIYESLAPEFDALLRHIQTNANTDQNIKEYKDGLNYIMRRQGLGWLEDLRMEFIRTLQRKIDNYNFAFMGIDDRRLENALDNISSELKSAIRRLDNRFEEEYQELMARVMKNNATKIYDNLQQLNNQKQEIPKHYFALVNRALEYNGYQLIEENEKLYIKEKQSNQVVELVYDSQTDIFKAYDNSLGIKIQGDLVLLVDRNKNTRMITDSMMLETANLKGDFKIKISRSFTGFEFEYGGQKITNLTEISAIVHAVKSKLPGYYEELLQNKDFQELISQLEEHDKQQEEIYLDEQDNKVKVNPKNKELVALKLQLFGYQLVEKNEELYVIDLKTNQEHKIKAFNNSYGFEDQNAIDLHFNTNLTIRTPNNIIPNNIEFHQGKDDLVINSNLTKFNIYIGKSSYVIRITDKGLICTAKDANDQLQVMDNEEIIETIRTTFPQVAAYVVEKSKQNQLLPEIEQSNYTDNMIQQGPKRR